MRISPQPNLHAPAPCHRRAGQYVRALQRAKVARVNLAVAANLAMAPSPLSSCPSRAPAADARCGSRDAGATGAPAAAAAVRPMITRRRATMRFSAGAAGPEDDIKGYRRHPLHDFALLGTGDLRRQSECLHVERCLHRRLQVRHQGNRHQRNRKPRHSLCLPPRQRSKSRPCSKGLPLVGQAVSPALAHLLALLAPRLCGSPHSPRSIAS